MLDRIEEVVKNAVQSASVQKLHMASQTIEELTRQLQALDKKSTEVKRLNFDIVGKDSRDTGLLADRLASLESSLEIKKAEAGSFFSSRKIEHRADESEGDGSECYFYSGFC